MKYALKVTAILIAGLAGIVLVLLLTFNYFYFNINRLPKGEFLTEVSSPSGDYTVKTYVSYGGATVAPAVRGEVIFHERKDKKENIYWQYREEDAEIIWDDEHIVSINGIKLDVRHEVYDFREN